jgi:hypothetical protein
VIQTLSQETREVFCHFASPQPPPPGTRLLKQDCAVRHVYLLEAGVVKLTRTEEQGREMILDIRSPVRLVGVASVISNLPAPMDGLRDNRMRSTQPLGPCFPAPGGRERAFRSSLAQGYQPPRSRLGEPSCAARHRVGAQPTRRAAIAIRAVGQSRRRGRSAGGTAAQAVRVGRIAGHHSGVSESAPERV